MTLAVCDGGNIGDVVSSGASLAHEIHRAGVPLVVASQFPLSFTGSVHLASLLYGPLLEGRHPLHALDDVRRRLKALVPEHHDWAGLVVYAGLPDDLPRQLLDVRLDRCRRRVESAMSHLDALSSAMSPTYKSLGVAKVSELIVERLVPAALLGMRELVLVPHWSHSAPDAGVVKAGKMPPSTMGRSDAEGRSPIEPVR